MMNPLNREKVHFQVAREIENYILQNGLKKDSALPSEKQIAHELGIGRSSVREGLRLLEGMGIVRVLPGKGIFVDNKNETTIRHQVAINRRSLLEVLEVRRTLEIQTCCLAYQNADESDRAAIKGTYEALAEVCRLGGVVDSKDREFHLAIYKAAHNDFLFSILNNIMGIFLHVWEEPFGINQAFHDTFPLHERLYEGILKADDREIGEAVRQIIEHSCELVKARFPLEQKP